MLTFWIASAASANPPEVVTGRGLALWYLPMLLVAGGSVFLGIRRPRLALPAGLVILAVVGLVVLAGLTVVNVELPDGLDWRSVLVHGSGSSFVPVVGIVLVSAAIAGRTRHRH